MPLTAERKARAFQEALTFEGFRNSMQVNRELFDANFEAYQLSDADKATFANLSEPLDVLVLAHDWCGDVVANTPLFGKIEQETGKLRLHILLRDPDNQDIAALYPHSDGHNHIPTYIFYNAAGDEIGVFIERPDNITAQMAGWKKAFYEANPQFEGQGKPIGELADDEKKALLSYIKQQRRTVLAEEQAAIFEVLREIVSRTPALA